MLEEFDNALHPNDEILFFNENFNKVPFIASQRYILAVGLDKINLDEDNHFGEDDPDIKIHVRLLDWRCKFEKRKALRKRSMKKIPIAWHPKKS